jgi:hypothetical protein
MKIVMVVNRALSSGLAANTAAVLGLSLGKELPGIIGEDCYDGSEALHKGITSMVIPVLSASGEEISGLNRMVSGDDSLAMIGFSRIAQSSRSYEEYREKLSGTPSVDIEYSGICIYGNRTKVEALTGSLPLLS